MLLLSFSSTALQAQPARKPVVAVTRMKDLANTGQALALGTMIQTAITGTGKFRVIERDFGELDTEQALARSGKVTSNTPGRVGGFEGVDFIVYGTLTSASSARVSNTGANATRLGLGVLLHQATGYSAPVSGNCQNVVASVAVDIKIVDARSGEIAFAKQITQRTASATSCSNNAALDMTSLMRDVANQTATGLSMTMYPIMVAAVQPDGTFILNYGEGALVPGLKLSVFGKGQQIPDPATGAMMTIDGPMLGMIQVTEVTSRFSKATAVAPFATQPAIGSVVREATPAAVHQTSARKH